VAAIYFLKSAQLNLAEGNWGRFWLAAAILALAIGAWRLRPQSAAWVLLFLWVPLLFYACRLPTLGARSCLHVVAVCHIQPALRTPVVADVRGFGRNVDGFCLSSQRERPHSGKLTALMFALVVASYASVWRAGPHACRKHRAVGDTQSLNSSVQQIVARLPRRARFLMDISEHVGIMEQAGIPLRQVVNSEDHRPWKRPSDPDGLWSTRWPTRPATWTL